MDRHGGILLHPTSLPGPYGIGDLGPAAHQWITFLADSGSSLWQVLPLGPTGYGDSPYQTFSAFAGNPLLISPELLIEDGLLAQSEPPDLPSERVAYGDVIPWKLGVLDDAYTNLAGRNSRDPLAAAFQDFKSANADWLPEFGLFMALKEQHDLVSWVDWPEEYRDRDPQALADARHELADVIDRMAFRQFLFFRQWQGLREHAHNSNISIIGDIPIFVAHDSADVWANRHLFSIGPDGHPTVVAGVPPDYFSETGQLWGNPLYRWRAHSSDGYDWWIRRVEASLAMVDIIRLDHFRGFHDYWEIPAGAEDAVSGRWRKGPGGGLFKALLNAHGDLPLIAEDLGGDLGPGIERLRRRFDLPGMKVLQFAFGSGPDHEFLPHNYEDTNWVAYTGTHDNATARTWFAEAADYEQEYALRYLQTDPEGFHWALIRLTWASIARFALAPMQDFLGLGAEGRMNRPSTTTDNWQWRCSEADMNADLAGAIRSLNETYGRLA